MLIKYQALASQLKKNLAPIYIVIGPDAYLIEDAIKQIKLAYKQSANYEEKKLQLQSADDWQQCLEEANSYALFSENTLIDAYYDKKTWDAPAKSALNLYLQSVNSRCLILIRAPEIPSKQLQNYTTNQQVTVILATPLEPAAMRNWITQQLQIKNLQYAAQVPEIIQRHTEGNMLACAQVIEKLSLTMQSTQLINVDDLLQQLSDQSQYQLFDLNLACLQKDTIKAMTILKHAYETRVEPSLILWTLSNEIRLLLQLKHKVDQGANFNEACSQLKIWSNRISLYQKMMHHLQKNILQQLLQTCYTIDEQIKSSQTTKIWHNFELVVLKFCLGK